MLRRFGAGAGTGAAILLALFAGPTTGQGQHDPAGDPVIAVAWLAGCWEGTLQNGAVYEELWLPPRAGTMIGLARMTRDDRTLSFEFMTITADQETLVFAAQPAGRPPTYFRALILAPHEVTFENPEHDFPHRVIYRLMPPDQLFARIEGDRDGELQGMDFPLRRTPCPGSS
jgi:hypothetical protein